jgi:hypothetical protein
MSRRARWRTIVVGSVPVGLPPRRNALLVVGENEPREVFYVAHGGVLRQPNRGFASAAREHEIERQAALFVCRVALVPSVAPSRRAIRADFLPLGLGPLRSARLYACGSSPWLAREIQHPCDSAGVCKRYQGLACAPGLSRAAARRARIQADSQRWLQSRWASCQLPTVPNLSMVVLTSFLIHRGSAESKDSNDRPEAKINRLEGLVRELRDRDKPLSRSKGERTKA